MNNSKYTLIDVREPDEFERGHLTGAINIPSQSLMSGCPELASVPKNANIIVYCKTGSRSKIAMDIFKSMDYLNVLNGINKEITEQRFLH